MIRKLRYADIDFQKYESAIENSVQNNFYASKLILDHLCESWEILISGDYKFVMPIPLKKKFGVQFALMPLFCQQLGIFGKERNPIIEQEFFKYFIQNYKVYYYAFNYQNTFEENLKFKKNYFIQNTEYSNLKKNYFKGRKSAVKSSQHLTFKELELSESLVFIQTHFKGLDKKKDMDKFFTYLNFLQAKNLLKIYGAFKEEHLICLATVIKSEKKISLLGLINDDMYRKDNGASFIIDRILTDHISEDSFDFMGSTIRGIEVFFKSFGSELQEYAVIENSRKDLLKSLFRKV